MSSLCLNVITKFGRTFAKRTFGVVHFSAQLLPHQMQFDTPVELERLLLR